MCAFHGSVRARRARPVAARALAPQVRLSESAIETALARTHFDTQPINREAVDSQPRIADTLHRLELIVRPVEIEDAVWTPPRPTRRSA
jgi:sulfonate transport system substrate-binding protein